MAPVSTQRLVPIRPSPLKGVATSKTITVITPVSVSSSTLSVSSSAKRKLCSDSIILKTKKVSTGNNPPIATMGKRNARERNRVKQVNNSFLTLRQHIPGAAKAKKISKVDTLKKAVDYIRHLTQILEDHEDTISIRKPLTSSTNGSNDSFLINENINQYTQQTTQCTNNEIVDNTTESKVYSDQPPLIYPSYYYNENISPVSTEDYPINIEPSPQPVMFKTEPDFKPKSTLSFEINPAMTPTYSDVSSPLTPVSQVSFNIPQSQSSPFSISTPVYQSVVTDASSIVTQSPNIPSSYSTTNMTQSPNGAVISQSQGSTVIYPNTMSHSQESLVLHSPNSSAMYSPNSLPSSPTSSPPAVTTKSMFTPTFQEAYQCNNAPSFIKTRNFIIPAAELPYCLSPGMTSIDIEKATATTKADLDLLDAIHLWQQS